MLFSWCFGMFEYIGPMNLCIIFGFRWQRQRTQQTKIFLPTTTSTEQTTQQLAKFNEDKKKTFLTKIFSSFRSSFHNFRGFLWKILIMHGKSKKFGKKPKQKMLPKRIKIDCFGEWTFQERETKFGICSMNKKKTSNSSISHSHICPAKICFFSFRFSIYNFFSFFFKYWINNSTYFL